MGESFAEFGDLVFTLVISYISAIEFLYVVRHLYHYSFNHDANVYDDNGENMSQLQNSMSQQLDTAKNREAIAGTQVMKDGVPYKDGYRLEAQQDLIDQLKEQLKDNELSDLRRQEMEKELAKQMETATQLRKELSEAEAKYRCQLNKEEELSDTKQLEEQQQRETEEELGKIEAEEQARKLEKAEKQIELEQQNRELEEKTRQETEQKEKLVAEKQQREEQYRKEAEEQAQRLIEAEKLRETDQRKREELENLREQRQREEQEETEKAAIEKANTEAAAEAAAQNLIEIEQRLEEQLKAAANETELTEMERQLIESIKERNIAEEEGNEQKEAELLRKILATRDQLAEESEEEQSIRLIQREKNQEAKQRRIEENALIFLEAEKEMADLQAKMLDTVEQRDVNWTLDSTPQRPVIEEEPCIKKIITPLTGGETMHHTVKTQLAQDIDKPFSVSKKPLLFPGISDDASSIDPASSQRSSFSTQLSEEFTTYTEPQYPPQERQDPEGEDNALSNQQYSDEYLRSLDGIKQRPLMREDGSGRRRAFKKRRSSNSSNSSRDSRQSRDEELKMFTSLEEEELKDTALTEYTPIRYTSEPTLKVKGHHRRHKRSPAKDMRHEDDSLRNSLECLGEETNDPWGELKPEHYKHTDFWKREKTLSIDEEIEFEKPASSKEVSYNSTANKLNASSFEEATQAQNEDALTLLKNYSSNSEKKEEETNNNDNTTEEPPRSDNTNLQSSQTAETEAASLRSSASPSHRRSLCSERNVKNSSSSSQDTPTITIQTPMDFGPWRDEYGLIMEGLSDCYDFAASVNRSRSVSRNPSPANTAPNTPLPKDVSDQLKFPNKENGPKSTVKLYDDTENVESNESNKENIMEFIDGNEETENYDIESEAKMALEGESTFRNRTQHVAVDPSSTVNNQATLLPSLNIVAEPNNSSNESVVNEFQDSDMNTLVTSLRLDQSTRPRSRSKSPLPTSDNLQRSLESRRYKMIKHNEDVLEKLIESKLLPELVPEEDTVHQSIKTGKMQKSIEENKQISPEEQMDTVLPSLYIDRRRSRSRSPMRLPTPENLSKSLEKRRNRLVERNDEFIKQLEERSLTPDSPTTEVEYAYEIANCAKQSTTNDHVPLQNETFIDPSEAQNDLSREKMELLVQSLRVAQSKSRSKSPRPILESHNNTPAIDNIRYYCFENSKETKKPRHTQIKNAPNILIDFAEVDSETPTTVNIDDEKCSREQMDLLVQSLRVARSKSRSKTPMRLPAVENLTENLDDRRNKIIESYDQLTQHLQERSKTPEDSVLTVQYVYEFEKSEEVQRSRHSRSKSPSRSYTTSRSISPRPTEMELISYCSNTLSRSVSPQSEDCNEFHLMLNLEGSQNKTLSIRTEEQESLKLANSQRQLDEEALQMFKNVSEEMELRTLSSFTLDNDEIGEQGKDYLADLPITERAKLLKKSPTTPDYDRTISAEMRDVERIKQKMLQKGFKRSTYVGESMDLGSEFESLRREAARFQRSRSPSPSSSAIDNETAQKKANENRKIQDLILQELTSTSNNSNNFIEIQFTLTDEMEDTMLIRNEMLNSSFQTHTMGKMEEYEEISNTSTKIGRYDCASPFTSQEFQTEGLSGLDTETAERKPKEKVVHEISFSDFSRHLNADFFDTERRASDSVLIKNPEMLVQLQDDLYLEPDEYHHHRRFSLAQEQPVEEYPSDNYIFIEQVEVRTRSGSRTWLREDFYSEAADNFLAKCEKSLENSAEIECAESNGSEHHQEVEGILAPADDDEDYSNASDDDRQTVVEVDDEIDEDICDFNERGPADESHHETSECEEAEREMDHYAGRDASDWNRIVGVENIAANEIYANEIVASEDDEGAVGGLNNSPGDSVSFTIDQIYDDAIKNRKQSGILREYDSILRQMSSSSDIDEQYLLWSKAQANEITKNIELNAQLLNNECKESEVHHLGHANITSRQSLRLRSRYGFNPVVQVKDYKDDLQVDLDYKPKREYNWRKNFKLDDDNVRDNQDITLAEINFQQQIEEIEEQWSAINNKEQYEEEMMIDGYEYTVERENATLLSRREERNINIVEEHNSGNVDPNDVNEGKEEVKEKKIEKIKKKTKKKVHKEPKASLEQNMNKEDEQVQACENQKLSRRSSSIQNEKDSSKRKSRSRRSSKSSTTNEDLEHMVSLRSEAYARPQNDIEQDITDDAKRTLRSKKIKKRKTVKDRMTYGQECPLESKEELQYTIEEPINDLPAVSAVITPESSMDNVLSTLSPQNSVCVTPASIDSNLGVSAEELAASSKETVTSNSPSNIARSSSANLSRPSSSATTPADTFDILKDANFYPLF